MQPVGAHSRTTASRGPDETPVALVVNGREFVLRLEPRVSLLDALREHLGLTGTKKGCDQDTCGACTVWIDERRVRPSACPTRVRSDSLPVPMIRSASPQHRAGVSGHRTGSDG